MVIVRWIPLILFLAFAAATAGRIFLHWRATGANPYIAAEHDSAEGYIIRVLRWVIGGLVVALVCHGAGWDDWMGTLPWAGAPVAFWSGVGLSAAALIWVTVAQAQMGNAWRIGIDHRHATALVRHGLFAVSRNPIFFGMRLTLLSAVLLVPNAIVLASALAGEVLVQVQTRLEEVHLLHLHGGAYRAYTDAVHRWLGRRPRR
jgi:protein-S-isoprenylcysteine O-methyltransferase Ste14